MSFESITCEYLKELTALRNNAELSADFTPELSYKPVLHNYFQKIVALISSDIDIIFEPAKQGESGRPDWRFYDKKSQGNFGYIEGKGLSWDTPISISNYQDQIEKYLQLKSNLILTDGIEFCFFGNSFRENKRICIVNKSKNTRSAYELKPVYSDLEIAFRAFFKTPGFRQCTETEIIADAAKRAKNLAEISQKLSSLSLGSGLNSAENEAIEALHHLHNLLLKHHDPALKDNELFSDFIAQVLVFGILYAHRFITCEDDAPSDRFRKIKKFWEKPIEGSAELLPFHELIVNLNKQFYSNNAIGPLQTWYDDCCRCLAHTQLNRASTPDFHTLYENFLKAYDPKKKIDFGSFYTHPKLADMMVRMTEYIAIKELKISSVFSADNNIIDPCCGTGTFIESIINNIKFNSPVNIVGFEIQPAPYALANYRIALLREKLVFQHHVKIVLTNTLSDALEEKISAPCDLFDQEQIFAKELVRSPLILVIGNPPSSDAQKQHTCNKGFKIIQHLLDDFRPPKEIRKSRQNTQKHLQNDFMKFLRWACEKVLLNENGILAFVIPSSFFENPTYEYARKWMASKFNEIFLLKFDEDNRKGGASKNLFQTLQGRSVIFAIRGQKIKYKQCSFYFLDISHFSKQEKILFFEKSPKELIRYFKKVTPNESLILGIGDVEKDVTEVYSKGISLFPAFEQDTDCIFLRHCSGIKLAPTALFVHSKKGILQRRCLEIGDLNIPSEKIIENWFSGQRKVVTSEKLSPSIRLEFSAAINNENRIAENIFSYSFRPFLTSFVLLDENIFSKIKDEGGRGTRLRPELIKAFSDETNIGFAVAPAPKDIGTKLHRFVSFCWHISDNDLCSRQNAHVFCAKYPMYHTVNVDQQRSALNYSNISKKLAHLGLSEFDWVFYAYAIMVSGWYLKKFSSILYSSSDKIPKIPIHSQKDVLQKIIFAGKQIAICEDNAKWHFSQEDLFKRNVSLFNKEFYLDSYRISEDKIFLYTKNHSSPEIVLKVCPDILHLKVSGYDVVVTWLKFHSHQYTRTTFSNVDYEEFLNLLCAIQTQLLYISKLDLLLESEFSSLENWLT
ncbi:MAG: N-6 DNA methylase [Victivallales bacterium]|nr:N-6 DNA methylase [Victivallales bacterium]